MSTSDNDRTQQTPLDPRFLAGDAGDNATAADASRPMPVTRATAGTGEIIDDAFWFSPESDPAADFEPLIRGSKPAQRSGQTAHRFAPGASGKEEPGAPVLIGQRHDSSLLFSLERLRALGEPLPPTAAADSQQSRRLDLHPLATGSTTTPPVSASQGPAFLLPSLAMPPSLLAPRRATTLPTWAWVVLGSGLALLGILLVSGAVVAHQRFSQAAVLTVSPHPVTALYDRQPPRPPAPPLAGTSQTVAAIPTPPSQAVPPSPPAPALPSSVAAAARPPVAAAGLHGKQPDRSRHRSASSTSLPQEQPASAQVPSPPPGRRAAAQADDDLARLLGDPVPQRPVRAAATVPAARATPPAASGLSKQEVQAGMRAIQPEIDRCQARLHVSGTALVRATLGSTGAIEAAQVVGALADTPMADCIARAVRGARFKPFAGPSLRLVYPFILR